MIKIAIVGDIGSGKSYVAKLLGFPVFNADKEVGKIYKNNKKCFVRFKKKLPRYIKSYPINRDEISKAILDSKNNLKKITKIVHPIVRSKMVKFLKQNKTKKAVVLDIPLYFENKINRKKDIIIFVDAEKAQINKRLKKRYKFNLKVLKKFKKIQLSIKIKKKKSSFIIKNNFKNADLKNNVMIFKKLFLKNERNSS